MTARTYGEAGPLVLVLHGGPGAPGHMAEVARGLADAFRVIEPFQRGFTVAGHIADLRELIESLGVASRPALIGSSWGAMLALAFAAAHPHMAGPLVLIGCGTFDPLARARLHATLAERMTDALRQRLARLLEEVADPDERLAGEGRLVEPLYLYDAIPVESEALTCEARGHQETWADMLRLQQTGVYPAAFAAIRSPVLMLHGSYDPHPGRMILAGLRPHIPQIEYREWDRCGHYPWRERAVRDEFFAVLRAWLAAAV